MNSSQHVPIHQQDPFQKQIADMEQIGVIIRVNKAAPWISSSSIVNDRDGKKINLGFGLELGNLNNAV